MINYCVQYIRGNSFLFPLEVPSSEVNFTEFPYCVVLFWRLKSCIFLEPVVQDFVRFWESGRNVLKTANSSSQNEFRFFHRHLFCFFLRVFATFDISVLFSAYEQLFGVFGMLTNLFNSDISLSAQEL